MHFVPRARITKAIYEKLAEAFVEKPGNYNHASAFAGVHYRTAKRAWLEGWARPNFPALRRVVEEEQELARKFLVKAEERAKRDIEKQKIAAEKAVAKEVTAVAKKLAMTPAEEKRRAIVEREKVKLDAAEERAREAVAVKSALSQALTVLGSLGNFSKVSIALSKRAAEDLLADIESGNVTWKEALVFFKEMSLVGRRANQQLRDAMKGIRLHLGEPERILGVTTTEPTTKVDGQSAVNHLGEDRFRQAVIDLATGVVTPDVEALLEWQVDQATQH